MICGASGEGAAEPPKASNLLNRIREINSNLFKIKSENLPFLEKLLNFIKSDLPGAVSFYTPLQNMSIALEHFSVWGTGVVEDPPYCGRR